MQRQQQRRKSFRVSRKFSIPQQQRQQALKNSFFVISTSDDKFKLLKKV
jgi:hypothetical protein